MHGCFNKKEYGGVPIINNDNGRYSDYNRSVKYNGNCAVIIKINYQHGGKCYPHFAGDYFEVYQSNHLSKVIDAAQAKDRQVEFVPCTMHDVPIIFEQKE